MKFSDSNGYLKIAVCALFLCCHHGLRDYFITSLPLITSETSRDITASINLIASNDSDLEAAKYDLLNEEISLHINESLSNSSCPRILKEEWTSVKVGVALSIIHWTWIIPLIVSPFLVHRIPENWGLPACLLASCIVALFSDLSLKSGGSTGLIILRGIQGLCQGWCYPIVYYILQDLLCSNFAFPFFLIFLAPWLGSSLGMLIGGTGVPFLGCYLFSILSLILALIAFHVPLQSDHSYKLPQNGWRETITSFPVWACVGVQMGGVWALHTFFVGFTLTLDFKLSRSDLYWAVFIVVAIGGLSTRLIAQGAMGLMRHHFLSALNRRRVVIVSGNLLIILTLVINGVVGINNEWSLSAISLVALCLGTSFCLVGVRLNLHDLGPMFPGPFLLLGALGATLGAALASLLFPILSHVGCDPTGYVEDMRIPYLQAWLAPIAVIVVVGIVHLALLSVTPLPHQIIVYEAKSKLGNGTLSLSLHLPARREESDAKSFKSAKSAFTYKTAVSRTRTTRTISLRTVKEDNNDDVYSVAESEDCKSAFPEDDDNIDMQSIKSGVTFKSFLEVRPDIGTDQGVVMNVRDLDRTKEWLTTHHNTGTQLAQIISEGKEKVERNILLALQW